MTWISTGDAHQGLSRSGSSRSFRVRTRSVPPVWGRTAQGRGSCRTDREVHSRRIRLSSLQNRQRHCFIYRVSAPGHSG